MALRTIMTQEQPTLHKVARPVTNFDDRLHDLLDDMAETLAAANGAGLAAPQVGILRRVFLIDVDERGLIEFINPEILETSGEQDGVEGCLSLPDQWGMVKRPNHVKVRAQDRSGAWFELEGDELTARYLDRLAQGRQDDLRRQQTLVGPHRDDIRFTLNGRDARAFGSQGQQRSIVLAWKMAEVELSAEILGEQPLLLLDDVMSELDEQRRSAVVSFVQEGIQTVVTTTNLGYFPPELLEASKVVSFGG